MADRRYRHASRTFQGMVKVDGMFGPAEGEMILTALEAATAPPAGDDTRTARQRRADAFWDIARSFLDSGEAPGAEKPHVLVLTDLDAPLRSRGWDPPNRERTGPHPQQVRELACDCVISRIVFGPDREPVDVGRASRVIPPAMRRAVIAPRPALHPSRL